MAYSSQKAKAWRNLIVSAVNFGMETGHILWQQRQCHKIEIGGLPAIVSFKHDTQDSEISIKVAISPRETFAGAIPSCLHHRTALRWCGAYADGYLRCESENYLTPLSRCGDAYIKRRLMPRLAAIDVQPQGFMDHRPLWIVPKENPYRHLMRSADGGYKFLY